MLTALGAYLILSGVIGWWFTLESFYRGGTFSDIIKSTLVGIVFGPSKLAFAILDRIIAMIEED